MKSRGSTGAGSGDLHPPKCTKEVSQAVKEGWKRVIDYIREQAPSTQILAIGILPKVCQICLNPSLTLPANPRHVLHNDLNDYDVVLASPLHPLT